ncbi:MAG: NADH-quinone oxidoreductase subunit N [Chthoniobacterales bacterium]|nr:NADH-quinone oxidoreductase subunit N [Chthoniobacterales bacterium]
MIPTPALEIVVLVWGLVLLLAEAFVDKLDKRVFAIAGIVGLVAVLLGSFFLAPPPPAASTGFWSFYTADPLAIFFKRFALATTIFILIMAIDYAPAIRMGVPGANPQAGLGEFFALPIFTCAGLMWMASAIDFVMIFVSLELVTMSFYVLVTFTRRNPATLEAGVKYLILSALSTGFLVYGITWIFGVTGETNLARIGAVLARQDFDHVPLLFGFALVLVALGFKIAAVPFQIWVPDVYQGAPTPVTAFLSVGSKAAGFVVLLRVLGPFSILPQVGKLLVVIAALTLIYGNFAALPQTNLKRLLAYSSIAHAGYLLIGVVCFAGTAVAFYLVGYLLMTLLCFAVVVLVAADGGEQIEDYSGLVRRSPFLAGAMLVGMVSLAGIPFTAGFLGKFFIFDAAIRQGQTLLVVIGVITVGCGFYYYLKVIRAMFWLPPPNDAPVIQISPLSRGAIGLLIAGIFVFGVYPQPILNALNPPAPVAVTAGR